MPKCPTCGKQLDMGVRFCPDDGTPLTETAASGTHTPTSQPTKKLQLALPVLLGNRYRLTEVKGGGGMAKVYRAIDVTLEREVAVKLINPELRAEPEFDARFQREARIASQLADPHIVVVHDFGIDATHGPYLVMEYLQGQSLRERLQSGALPLKAALQLSAQLMLALIHAHSKGIVHRDIKPDNIFLLNQSGVRLHTRVLDFGIARIYRADDASHSETLTQPGAVLGTPRYMSPEQLAGQPVDARSDLFSAALVIHESLTGQLPYVSSQKLCEICPEATAALQDLLEQCLRPTPKDRPASAVEVYLRLQELGKASGILLLPPGAMDKLVAARQAQQETVAYTPATAKRPMARRRLLLILALLALLAVVAGSIFALVNWLRPVALLPPKETLLDIQVGDSRDDVIVKMKVPPRREQHGNPWQEGFREVLGHVLRPEDLGDPVALADLDALCWSNDDVCVILRHNAVQALVVRAPHPAHSGRGLKMGDSLLHLEQFYPEEPDIGKFHPSVPEEQNVQDAAGRGLQAHLWASKPPATATRGPSWGKTYRYDTAGIGFELLADKITAITLYPPRQ